MLKSLYKTLDRKLDNMPTVVLVVLTFLLLGFPTIIIGGLWLSTLPSLIEKSKVNKVVEKCREAYPELETIYAGIETSKVTWCLYFSDEGYAMGKALERE